MTFGETVIVRGVYHRRWRSSEKFSRGEKYWHLHEIEPRSGIYLGKRTLFNGGVKGGGYEDSLYFKSTEHFPVILVIFNERENPVYCPSP